ncbi:hypothetical protein CRG98_003311 [Punica granatum]|uniref:Uncharacterized protein n=1 Tax=Punica granatum TaxID=22663 RepID=A0A2I0L6G4_PUNGR|nr:hypothetical protein CRG98_003311 [Punica granatum]
MKEDCVCRGVVDEDINVRQRNVFFGAGPIEVSVVNANSDPYVFLFYRHNVVYPFIVVVHFQETRINLLNDLFLDAEEKAGSLELQVLPLGRKSLCVERVEGTGFVLCPDVDFFCGLDEDSPSDGAPGTPTPQANQWHPKVGLATLEGH